MSRFFKSRDDDSSNEDDGYSTDSYSSSYDDSDYDGSRDDSEYDKDSDDFSVEGKDDDNRKHEQGSTQYTEQLKKVSKSYKQKYEDELRKLTNGINSNVKNANWIGVLENYDVLVKLLTSGIKEIDGIPRHVARTVFNLEEKYNEVSREKEVVKKFNQSTTKAFNVLRQKLKHGEKVFKESIERWKENPLTEEQSTIDREEFERQNELLAKGESDEEDADQSFDRSDKKARRERRMVQASTKKLQITEAGETELDNVVQFQKRKTFDPKPEDMMKHLERIFVERGKKSTDRLFHVQQLEVLLNMATKPEDKCKILSIIIPARIDLSSASKSVNKQCWLKSVNELSELLDILWENAEIKVCLASDKEKLTNTDSVQNDKIVFCNITTYIKGIYKEFVRSIQDIDPKTTEYLNCMKDEYILYILAVRIQKYFEIKNDTEQAIYAALRRLKHIYYRQDDVIKIFEDKLREARPELLDYLEDPNCVVETLCKLTSKSTNELVKTHSFLVYIYNLALNDKEQKARDLVLMSHLQNNIHKADVSTQILYNRAIVQLGLCAFRNSHIKTAVTSLHEIIYSGHSRELLAQGAPPHKHFSKFKNKSELQRLLPYFMHINVELFECIYLTSSMLLEVPSMVLNYHDTARRMYSRQFCRMIDYNERQPFTGPPENVRDHITAASFALASGDWKACRNYILSIKLWDLMPKPDAIKDMMTLKIKECAVKTFLYTNYSGYKSIFLSHFVDYFELPLDKIKVILSKMITTDEIDAYLDEKAGALVFEHGSKQEISKLQQLAIFFSNKLSSTIENSEKVLEGLNLNAGIYSVHDTHDNVSSGYYNTHQNSSGHRRDRDFRSGGGGLRHNNYNRYNYRDNRLRS